jgi:hypothetical protein
MAAESLQILCEALDLLPVDRIELIEEILASSIFPTSRESMLCGQERPRTE